VSNILKERFEKNLYNLSFFLFTITFLLNFISIVQCRGNSNEPGNNLKASKYINNFQCGFFKKIIPEKHKELEHFSTKPSSIGYTKMFHMTIKKNMDLSLENAQSYFHQKDFSERLNLSNENQNNQRTEGWGKTLAIVGELTGSFVGGHGTALLLEHMISDSFSTDINVFGSYLLGESIGSFAGTFVTAKLSQQQGSIKNTFLGSGIGTVIGFCGFFLAGGGEGLYRNGGPSYEIGVGTVIVAIAIFAPSVCSVIGYNKK
jgi:hypothetical protein